MEAIKALFFDMDSTLYTHRIHDFPISTKETLTKLKQQGYKIGFATSRCRYETKNLPSFFHNFDFDAKIYDGGALVIVGDKILNQTSMASSQIHNLLAYTKEHQIPVRYATYEGDCMAMPCSPHILDEFFKLYLNMPIIKPYEGEDVYNMLAYPSNDELLEGVKNSVQESFVVEHSKRALEITAQGIDKGKAIKSVCEHWNIPIASVVCFGDGANDVGMLKEAGIGIAMGNANDKAKAAADKVCGHIDEDGLSLMCEELELLS